MTLTVTEHPMIGMWECLEREEWVEWRKLSALTIYVMSVAEFEGSALVVILVLVCLKETFLWLLAGVR